MPSMLGRLSLLVCLLWPLGCARFVERGQSPLAKPVLPPDSVVLEVFFVRMPLDDPRLGPIWAEIDEQPFDADLRRRLAESGFRAGVIKGQLPTELQQLIAGPDPSSAKTEKNVADPLNPPEQSPPQPEAATVVDLQNESPVRRQQLPLRAGWRSLVLASGVYDSWPLLEKEGDQLRGRPYAKAQGVFGVKSFPQPDGRVRLELLPELHHGDPKVGYTYEQGVLRFDTGRAKKVFDDLALSVTLSPGEMVVLGRLPEHPGSVGHYFFTEQWAGALAQKLLLVRLAQTQYDDLFGEELAVTPKE